MPRVCDSELNEIMCVPKHSLRSGLGARSVLRRSPASGSAERHLPFPHKSAPVGRSISTGDGRRVSAQPRHTGVFLLTNLTSQRRHQGPCSPRCARVWIKFPRLFSFWRGTRVCVRERGGEGKMRITVASRGWWCPAMNAGWCFVLSAHVFYGWSDQTLARSAEIKARIWFYVSVSRGMGTVLIRCNLLFPPRITLYCNCIMSQLDEGFLILGFSVELD